MILMAPSWHPHGTLMAPALLGCGDLWSMSPALFAGSAWPWHTNAPPHPPTPTPTPVLGQLYILYLS